MVDNIVEIIEKIVEHKIREIYMGSEIGIVTEVFPHSKKSDYNNYSCNVKLKNPDEKGNFLELKKVPVATNHIGTVAIPNVGDLVLISFVQGSIHQPIIIGRLYHYEMRPPISNINEVIHQIPNTPGDENKKIKINIKNHLIDDKTKEKKREIIIEMPKNIKLSIYTGENDNKKRGVEIEVDKKSQFKITKKKESKIEIINKKSQIIIDEKENIKIKSNASIKIEAKDRIELKAKEISIKAKNTLKEKAISTEIKGKSILKLKSSGPVKVKGSIIDLN